MLEESHSEYFFDSQAPNNTRIICYQPVNVSRATFWFEILHG